MSETPDNRWHLDKRIPLAFVLAMLAQTGGMVWWAATMDSRVSTLERDMIRLQSDQQRDRDNITGGFRDLRTWLDGRFDRFEGKLDRKVDKP